MHRSAKIVLGRPSAPLPAQAKTRPLRAVHWRNWRGGGAALSLALHAVVLAALTTSVPVMSRQAEPDAQPEKTLPVEIVQPPPPPEREERKTEAQKVEPPRIEPPKPDQSKLGASQTEAPKAEARKTEPRKPEPPKLQPPKAATATPVEPKPPERELARRIPEPPRPPAAPTLPNALTAPTPDADPEPPRADAPPPPVPAPEAPVPPEPAKVPDVPAPKEGTPHGLKVDAEEIAPPGDRAAYGHWILEPLTVNLGHRCGIARITGALDLNERVAEGRYRGIMRTRIAWASCPPEGVLHHIELRIRGNEVQMVGTSGFVDRGVIRNNTMMLEDAFGRSVWVKR